ncbi:MAG: hypothetical protein JW807_14805 [Spirochaetes bacterium]|nr:hypothetical protein [Spirochaetota bacterium]
MKIITIGNNTGNTYGGLADTSIGLLYWEGDVSTLNAGGSASILLANVPSAYLLSGLIDIFGLLSIPGPVKVTAARLRMYGLAYGAGIVISCRRVLRDWIAGTQDGLDRNLDSPPSACWIEYGNNQPWTIPGCLGDGTDRDNNIIGTITTTGTAAQWFELNSPAFMAYVEGCINGTIEDKGLIMTIESPSGSALVILNSSENDDGTRPYIEISLEPIPPKSITGNIDEQYIKGKVQPSYIKGEVN